SNTEALQEVEQRLKHEKSRRMFERYQTIRLYLLSHDYSQIATSIGRSEYTVKEYVRTYRKHGLDGLIMKFSTGAPERLTKEQQSQLKQTIIDSLPHEVGFPAKFNWTLEIIALYIHREFGRDYSIRGVSKMMHRLGLSYTKPTYTLAAADKEKQKEFVESTFPELKKLRRRRN
ncbi:transposase, partial [Paenibacillus tyrfis]